MPPFNSPITAESDYGDKTSIVWGEKMGGPTDLANDIVLTPGTSFTGTIKYPGDPNWRYDEGKILDELRTYLGGTYKAHYVGEEDSIQAIDLIAAGGMVMHFAAASIIKYAFRFGKKDGQNRKDLLKVIHYAMFMLWRLNRTK